MEKILNRIKFGAFSVFDKKTIYYIMVKNKACFATFFAFEFEESSMGIF